MGIVTEIAAGATAEDTHVHVTGEQDLGLNLGYGGVVAAMDAWQAFRGDAALPAYQLEQQPGTPGGWGRGYALPVHAAVDDSQLAPESLRTHVWDNLRAAIPNKFSTALQVAETVEDSVSLETKLDVTVGFSSTVKVSGGPVAASGTASFSATAEIGKTWSRSRSLTVGTTDGAESELPPHTAELLILSSLKGPLLVITTIQTEWRGAVRWRYGPKAPWQTVDLSVLMQHGLARPCDPHGTHNGLLTQAVQIGTVSEVDQTAVSIADTSKETIREAIAGELQSRWPERQTAPLALPPSLGGF